MEANVFIRNKQVLFEFIEYCVSENLFNTFQVKYVGSLKGAWNPVYQVTYESDENVLDEFLGELHSIFSQAISETCPELEELPF